MPELDAVEVDPRRGGCAAARHHAQHPRGLRGVRYAARRLCELCGGGEHRRLHEGGQRHALAGLRLVDDPVVLKTPIHPKSPRQSGGFSWMGPLKRLLTNVYSIKFPF